MSAVPPSVDLNADLGEGSPAEAALMPLITSANIACGGHAGDSASMRAAIAAALAAGVAVGAHPSTEDRAGFGRTVQPLAAAAARELVLTQVSALQQIAGVLGARVVHVKPHGALYNLAARDPAVAAAVAAAVQELDPRLILFGLAGGELIRAGIARGLAVAEEVFADRTYQADGSLTPRSQSDALIADEAAAAAQVLSMVRRGTVRATDGTWVPLRADTVCLHGDGLHAVAWARRLRRELESAGIALAAVRPNRAANSHPSPS
jgi:UPF0271 protein